MTMPAHVHICCTQNLTANSTLNSYLSTLIAPGYTPFLAAVTSNNQTVPLSSLVYPSFVLISSMPDEESGDIRSAWRDHLSAIELSVAAVILAVIAHMGECLCRSFGYTKLLRSMSRYYLKYCQQYQMVA
jgi:hypothetical protein